ncbi:ROK family transcriptional regulator [Leucothrix pacifica]|uniref:Sugar kinase n=1 Tax=Leucothrix pacifica TaxID=1247513 RepID=A0A317CGH7_9GAMM|nr:ROK family transcriptional regulator [Leucothrix pacifica]PWQ97628.1 sugar kinase [Leucothrix pacifica]
MPKLRQNLSRGTNQTGGRIYNERLVLSIVRHQDGLPKSEIAQLTGLSAQTISVIMQQLEADQLIVKGQPQRGKVGQPSVPFSLNPEGAYSIGLKIGRHSSELVLMNFVGSILETREVSYRYPVVEALLAFVEDYVPELIEAIDEPLRDRMVGIGIATPFELWNWGDEVGAPKSVMDAWNGFDIKQEVSHAARLPAYMQNDATAACAAELTFGNEDQHDNFLYIYIGYFIGGGVVLNGSIFEGPNGNAGSLGALPIRIRNQGEHSSGDAHQLIRDTSKISLQRLLEAAGEDAGSIWDKESDWSTLGDTLDTWIDRLTDDLAYAIVSAISVIDFPAIVIDGDLPALIRTRITQEVSVKIATIDKQGLSPVTVVEGSLGNNARVLGGASLPLLANFTRNRDVAFGADQ